MSELELNPEDALADALGMTILPRHWPHFHAELAAAELEPGGAELHSVHHALHPPAELELERPARRCPRCLRWLSSGRTPLEHVLCQRCEAISRE